MHGIETLYILFREMQIAFYVNQHNFFILKVIHFNFSLKLQNTSIILEYRSLT